MSNLPRTPPGCIKTNTMKRSRTEEGNSANGEPLSLNTAVEMLMKQFAETKTLIDNMRSEIHSKIDAVKTELDGKLNAVALDIQSLRVEYTAKFQTNSDALDTLNGKVNTVSSTVQNIENRNDLIINGIPYLKGEDLTVFFRAICKHLDIHGDAVPLVDIRRLKSGPLNDGDSSLVLVQFAMKNVRDDFYGAYLRKRELQLCHLGFDSTRRVYVNENLTLAVRKLKAAAIRLKKAGKLSSVYTKTGVVYVKPTSDARPVAVQSEEQLNAYA